MGAIVDVDIVDEDFLYWILEMKTNTNNKHFLVQFFGPLWYKNKKLLQNEASHEMEEIKNK